MRTEQRNVVPRLMNVAFCSSSVGCGHTRASVAIHDALRARGQLSEATFIEALEHAPRWFSTVYRDGYLRAIRHAPRVVGAIYNSTDSPRRDRRPLGPALDRFEDRIMANFRAHPRLHTADVVVSTHFLTSALLGRMRLRGELQAPVVTVVTDEHPHAVWLHRGVDLTCVASRAARTAAIAGGMDPARVEITGIPIDPRFCMTHQRSFAVTEQPRPMILVCGGGHGLGDIPAVVRSLLATSLHCTIVVVCGKNAALEVAMRGLQSSGNAEGAGGPELRVLGYSNAMHELMAAADLMGANPAVSPPPKPVPWGSPWCCCSQFQGKKSETRTCWCLSALLFARSVPQMLDQPLPPSSVTPFVYGACGSPPVPLGIQEPHLTWLPASAHCLRKGTKANAQTGCLVDQPHKRL